MEKDTIITLEDNTKYVLLDETLFDKIKYFFAIKLDEKTGNPTTDYEIFEQEIENDEVYMNTLEDNDLKEQIFLEFSNKYLQNIKAMEEQ